MGIAVAHVEAGLRSFDRTMPEELNRILTDHLAAYLFVTEPSGRRNLLREGIAEEKIFFVGNVMADTLLRHKERARRCAFRRTLGLAARSYGLLTLHRPGNVDSLDTLAEILQAVRDLAEELPIVFPCHPRTRQHLDRPELQRFLELNGRPPSGRARVVLLEPLGYLEFLSLMGEARLVLTDSGGIQEETTVLGVPCLTLRENTERPVTVEQGTNRLVGASRARILSAADQVLRAEAPRGRVPELWDGHAAERIAAVLESRLAPCAA
jgi:UDP-N-acetylglucosamine 2-epimerase (non-hydrolysing)